MVLIMRHYRKTDAHSPNIDPKSFENGPKIVPKCSQMGAWSVPKLIPDFGIDFAKAF